MGIRNVASNEELRDRWNGAKKNEEMAEIYKDKSSCLARANHFLFSGSAESKLQKYCELVETYEKMEAGKSGVAERDPENQKLLDKNN